MWYATLMCCQTTQIMNAFDSISFLLFHTQHLLHSHFFFVKFATLRYTYMLAEVTMCQVQVSAYLSFTYTSLADLLGSELE